MDLIQRDSLVLFDFDGLLVDSEKIHLAALKEACSRKNVHLTWDLPTYLKFALLKSNGIKIPLLNQFPRLDYENVMQEKRKIYVDFLKEKPLELMPGAASLLHYLEEINIARCVVTNSPLSQIEIFKEKIPLLHTIPHYVTREQYKNPKPSPDSYLKAMELYGEGKRPIGFEDSPKGLQALLAAQVKSVFVSAHLKPEFSGEFITLDSLEKVLQS